MFDAVPVDGAQMVKLSQNRSFAIHARASTAEQPDSPVRRIETRLENSVPKLAQPDGV